MTFQVKVLVKAVLACATWAAIASSAQAATMLTADPARNYVGNTAWQNLGAVSYSFADTNGDNVLQVGEKVTFTVDMQKDNWGTHRFDALKVWLVDPSVRPAANLYTGQFTWDYASGATVPYAGMANDPYSWKPWTQGDKSFSFSYTFSQAGSFDLLASVMCSRDLSDLVGSADDKPTAADWNAWTKNIHKGNGSLQGEDKTYHLVVAMAPVPEPETYAMLLAGLGLMATVARRRKPRS
jgi:hypothetical protein